MIEVLFALGAGLISFLSPCVLPLIPGYIAYISGSTLDEILEKKNINLLPIILFSLHIIGIINIKFLNYEKRIQTTSNKGSFAPILIGMAFAFGWTPCIGPILGSILIYASTTDSLPKGIMLLSFYSIGLALPFILSGYLIQKFMLISKNLKQKMILINRIGGSLLLITGILIITNQLQIIGYYLLEIFPFLQNFG